MGWDDVNSHVLYVGQPYTAPESQRCQNSEIIDLFIDVNYLPPLRVLGNAHRGEYSLAIKRDRGEAPPAPDRVAATCLCPCLHMHFYCGETELV